MPRWQRRESSLKPGTLPPKVVSEQTKLWKVLVKLLWFVVIHQILGR